TRISTASPSILVASCDAALCLVERHGPAGPDRLDAAAVRDRVSALVLQGAPARDGPRDHTHGMVRLRRHASADHARHYQHPHGRDESAPPRHLAADRSRGAFPQMTTRIGQRFAELKRDSRAGLVTFTMAGDPDTKTSLEILKALPKAGADAIELGMPFTDPMADGPAVQAGGLRALNAGQIMVKTLAMIRAFRKYDDTTPIVLMGYYNPIYIYGVERFLADAKSGGVDALIVVDLPPEEHEGLCLPALKAGLNFIRLATPTTDDRRLPAVLANTSGFVYYVSI